MDMDDYFSDDDLDGLNANALQELENNALQLTQAQRTYNRPNPPVPVPVPPKILPPPPPRGQRWSHVAAYGFDDDDFDDAVVVAQNAPQPKSALPPARAVAPAKPPAQLPSRVQPRQTETWRPVVSADNRHRPQPANPANPAFRPPARPAPVGPRASQQLHSRNQAPLLPRPAPTVSSGYQSSQAPRQTGAATSHEFATLQAQVLDLKSKLTTKEGEVSIVRKLLEKAREDHEREVQIVRAQAAEKLAKKERESEAARAAQQSAVTELEFTRRDLREEVVRAKRHDGPSTPKKIAKTWGVSDGFEDVEMAASPSKGKRGKNAGPVAGAVVEPPAKLLRTPTKSKRKRPAMDSPVTALETHSEDVVMMDDAGIPVHDMAIVSLTAPVTQSSVPFDYLKVILNHSSAHGRPLAFEYLSRFELPSRPNESIASILLRKLSTAGDPGDPTQLPVQFCLEVIRLWDACRAEKVLAPITELVSLVSFTTQLQTVALAPYIAPSLLPVAMDSCYAVAIPRFNNPAPGEPTTDEFTQLRDNIDTRKILSLMYLTVLGCATSKPAVGSVLSPAVDFWSQVHIQFILVYLNRKQPIDDFIAVLRLLCTSVFPDSIGPINPDKTPEEIAQLLIDRISVYMTDTSRWDADETKLRDLRLASLQTLSAFARSQFGLVRLAKHDWIIPRLVTLLSYSIEELYDGDMQYSSTTTDDSLQSVVAHTMFLLHMIVTSPQPDGEAAVDVSAKLAKTTGGSQKYLLSLSRLNFADDLVSEDTAELAHELLELAVTSEAGEELGLFFSG
ncbi:hypothetical protein F4679DRAFT_539982 [Xylaria curta]|nr:hypothetical protein F4679DRAFT_539982 [Xylaria curta]